MHRFPVSFGKRKSAAYKDDADANVSSFRVLERTEVAGGVKSFDGHAAVGRPITTVRPYSRTDSLQEDDNMFAGLNVNRESGSSNTTKTASTDTSSRHSAVSTAPSSATPATDFTHQQQQQQQQQQPNGDSDANKRPYADIPIPPVPKSSSGFFNRAGRTFSFGSSKKSAASDEAPPPVPAHGPVPNGPASRARGLTSSTTSTATPPKVDEGYGGLDLGGDFGTMFNGFDKRASVATLRDKMAKGQHPRSLTGNLMPQQQQDRNTANMKPPISPHSINSEHSNDGLLTQSPQRHGAAYPPTRSNRPSDIIEDEDSELLKDSLAASKYLGGSATGGQSGQLKRSEDPRPNSSWQGADNGREDDNMFDNSFLSSSRVANRYVSRPPSPPRNRVMTPAQFERYKQEKQRTTVQGTEATSGAKDDEDDEDEENYEDDEDEMEKSRQATKQRKKQEAHMAVYRQQMMKVTGDSVSPLPRPPLGTVATAPPAMSTKPDSSDDDEEIPLAILAAHGFPNRNRPPTRLTTAASNPNLRASMLAPPQSASGSPVVGPGSRASHLPAFARNLPQDPFVGAGLVRNSARESIAMGGGSPAAQPQPPLPPGGLVGVIAQEERSRAMRRGSPHIDNKLISQVNGTPGQAFDPIAGIPPQMMYGMNGMNGSPSMQQMQMQQMQQMMGQMGYPQGQQPMLTPGDQAQIQMTQQMQQFMQMQMQFMQMMAGNQGGAQPNSFMAPSVMGDLSSRHSFVGGDYPPAEPRPYPVMDNRMRTMSMVQPSSASWIQPLGGYTPSIRIQGDGYAPSIAPSERSNIGLPGRYRPVSQMPIDPVRRVSTMSGALSAWDEPDKSRTTPSPVPPKSGNQSDDDDDDEGWAAMKAKREKKKSLWRSKKGLSSLLS